MIIRKFTESKNSFNITWEELSELISNKRIKLIGYSESEFKQYFTKHFPNPIIGKYTHSFTDGENVCYTDNNKFVLVIGKMNDPEAIIFEYELFKPFIFDNIVVCPGHDSVTCYSLETKNYATNYIR
jgi:hypothetical protein